MKQSSTSCIHFYRCSWKLSRVHFRRTSFRIDDKFARQKDFPRKLSNCQQPRFNFHSRDEWKQKKKNFVMHQSHLVEFVFFVKTKDSAKIPLLQFRKLFLSDIKQKKSFCHFCTKKKLLETKSLSGSDEKFLWFVWFSFCICMCDWNIF